MKRENEQCLPLAIVGAGCRFAGANNLDEFWDGIRSQRCAISELPDSHLDQSLHYDPRKGQLGKTYSRIGGFVSSQLLYTDRIPATSELLDIADSVHLKFLDVVVEAIERAGWEPDHLRGSRTGVYVGHARGGALWGEMAFVGHAEELLRRLERLDLWQRLDGAVQQEVIRQTLDSIRSQHPPREIGLRKDLETGRVASLVAEVFGCNGPAVAIDAACASAFLALAQAANALRRGVIEQAIVGGASHSNWYSLVMFSHAQALSATGSFPFDERADGFVSSDGYAAILLKTLPKALADGDRILGVIRGIGVSTDGRGKSLWAPRKEGQIAAMQRAYGDHLDVESLGYVEAHGTSTRVGDATELEAVADELGRRLPPGRRIPISSVKANIGHTRETAGLAGLLKTLMILKHGVIPAATGFETPNPDIPWGRIPFFVPREELAWPDEGRVRRAAVDAFGIGGLNAHVVVDDRVEMASKTSVSVPENLADLGTVAEDAVAVIGAGAIFPGARTIDDFRKLIAAGTSAWCDVPTDRWDAEFFRQLDPEGRSGGMIRRAGFVTGFEYDWRKHQIPPKQVECADPLQFMLLDATDQAIRNAAENGSRPKSEFLTPELRRRTSILVGAMMGGDFAIQLNLALRMPEMQQALRGALARNGVATDEADALITQFRNDYFQHNRVLEDETGSYTSSTLASRLAKTLDVMGGALTLDGGGVSAPAALGCAFDQLLQRQVDLVICAAGHRNMDVSVWDWMSVRGWLQPDPTGGTQQSGAVGTILGEGTGVVLLKRLSDARRDGDNVLAILRGYGASLDQNAARAVATAAERALAQASLPAKEVAYVETTSLGIACLDQSETEGLNAVFSSGSRTEPLQVGSITSQIGFGQSVAGMAGLLRMATAFADRRLPATLTSEPIVLPNDSVSIAAGLSSQALRPMAYHWIVQSPPRLPTVKSVATTWQIARFAASSATALMELVSAAISDSESAWQSATRSAFSSSDKHRLAIVAESATELHTKLMLTQSQMDNLAARPALEEQGVFVNALTGRRPRVAFVFSGQGSQYAGMFRELVSQSSLTARVLAELDEQLRSLSLPTIAELAWIGDAEDLGRDLFSTQLSVLLADTLAFRVLRELGLRPDVFSDHSYGEYAALVAAGAWSLETAIQATRRRCEVITACPSARGRLLSTSASWELAERFVREVGGELFLANGNAPDQTVLGGREQDIERLAARLTDAGLQAKVIPVPAPFHTPLMAECQPLFRSAIAELTIGPPTTPLLSSVTNRYVADPLDLRDNLVEQFVRPVRFVELSQRLVADGCDLLIEVGPRQIVSRLLRRCVPSSEVAVIAFDNPKRPGLEALLRVQALFEVRGGICERTREAVQSTERTSSVISRGAMRASERPPTRPLFFDATTARREKRVHVAETAGTTPVSSVTESANEVADELQTLLINFVCEQTGYPAEIVTMDADLEADLGIDSIKKAQLLGELREQFVFQQAPGNMSLSDFPTLRHIYNFLKDSPRRSGPDSAASAVPSTTAPSTVSGRSGPSQAPSAAVHQPASRATNDRGRHGERDIPDRQAWQRLNVAFFRGSRYDIGRLHGERDREVICNAIQSYADYFEGKANEFRPLVQALERQQEFIPPDGFEELRGMAEACDIPVSRLVAFNFGLCFEHVAGCSQIAIPARHNGQHGLIHAINEDLILGLLLGDKLRRVVQVRHPDEGIPHVLFSTCGQLGALNGFNSAGLCITSTLLLDRFQPGMPTPGWIHSFVVQTLLQTADNVADAVRMLREMRRCGAWSLCLSDRNSDHLMYLEYDGDQLWERTPDDRCFFSTNHALLAEHVNPIMEGSRHRYERLDEIFQSNGHDGHSAAFVQSILSDVYDRERGRVVRHPTMNTIRRSDTQASIVMCPSSDEVWVTQNFKPDPEAPREFTRLGMSELFQIAAQPESFAEPEELADDPQQASRVMRRFVLRTGEQPLPDAALSTWDLYGPVVVLGEGKLATELTRRLTADGKTVASLPITVDAGAVVAEFERLCATECPQSILIADDVAVAEEDSCLSRALTIYRVLQTWLTKLPEDQLARGTLVGLTTVGADFGWTSPVLDHAGGGVAGLCKAIQREFAALRVLVLDVPSGEPAPLVAAALQRELDAEAHELEVSWVRQRRRTVRMLSSRPRPIVGAAPRQNGTWIVTGGARGITFAVARELAKRYRLKLHLVGSSPRPQVDEAARQAFDADPKGLRTRTIREARQSGSDPNVVWKNLERSLEIDRNLRALEADGLSAAYHACDVSDAEALTQLLDDVRRLDGPIHGVLHGAGVEEGSKFARKRIDRVAATLNVKVGGALHLIRLLANDPLEHFIGFGSISGRFGNVGQSDYSMASDWLAKVVGRLRTERPSVSATTFHWPAWDEVGMAARPESRVVLEAAGSRFLPLAEGCEYVLEELEAGCPESEVLILDEPHRFDLPGQSPSNDSPTRAATERRAVEFPLLNGVRECSTGSLAAEARFDPARDVFLTEHQFAGVAILPAAVGLELIAEAASLLMRRRPTGLANVEIVNGLRFSGRPQVVQVRAVRNGSRVDCEIVGDFFNRDGRLVDPQRVFLHGTVLFETEPLTVTTLAAPMTDHWKKTKYLTFPESLALTSMFHGPVLQCMHEAVPHGDLWFSRMGTSVQTALRGSRSGSRWLLPSILLDGCFQLAALARRIDYGYELSLPLSLAALHWSRLPVDGEECVGRARLIERDERDAVFAIELATTDGQVLLELDHYRTVAPAGSEITSNEPATKPNASKMAPERATVAGREG